MSWSNKPYEEKLEDKLKWCKENRKQLLRGIALTNKYNAPLANNIFHTKSLILSYENFSSEIDNYRSKKINRQLRLI